NCISTLKKHGVEALVAIGGDDTLSVATKLYDRGVKAVGVPKTIDNDLSGTDFTSGVDTAVNIVTEAIDRVHTTAEAHNRERLGGSANTLAQELERRTGFETRTVVLGHIQRGGSPTAFDRVLATRYGLGAVDMVHRGEFGKMAALRGNKIVSVSLAEATGQNRK